MGHPALPAVAAAADCDLFREELTRPAVHRTAAGTIVANHAVTVGRAAGYLGDYIDRVVLPDGVFAYPVPLTDAGLDWYIDQVG